MTQNLILLISMISLFVSCNNGNKDFSKNSDKELITQLISKYPELAKDTIGDYKLMRTVIIGVKNISVKLYSTDHEYNTPNNIIVINNSAGEKFAIPLFSNNFRKYWNFENETKTFDDKVYNSLFEKEFIIAINRLKLNDTLGTGRSVMYEIFHSLLHFQQVSEHDYNYLEELGRNLASSNSYNDDDIESEHRNSLNIKEVLNGITISENVHHYNALLDMNNYRVFQIEFPKKRNMKIQKLNIKIYRLGEEVIPLIM